MQGLNCNYTLNGKALSPWLACEAAPDDYFIAYLQAVRDIPGPPDILDWQILTVLKHHPAGITFSVLYRTFNKCQQTNTNNKYYRCMARLTDKGLIRQGYNSRGWRLWSITPEGRQVIIQLNESALKYLPIKKSAL